jgi:hypothetical protein
MPSSPCASLVVRGQSEIVADHVGTRRNGQPSVVTLMSQIALVGGIAIIDHN